MQGNLTGVARRLVATGAAVAVATAGLVVASSTTAYAAPVNVTTTLTDQAGNVIDGRIQAYLQNAEGYFDPAGGQEVADGVVNLPVEPGVYKFEFSDDKSLFAREFYNDKATLETAEAVTVAGPTALAAVSLAPAPAVTGQVLSPTGKPIRGAGVTIYRASDNVRYGYARTRPDGTFAYGVPVGTYKVGVTADDMAAEFYNNKPSVETADPIAVTAAGANIGVITLSKGAVVTGRITSDAGAPLERARASIYVEGATGSFRSDLTDSAGVYRIEGVPAGNYQVEFSDPINEFTTEWRDNKATRATSDLLAVGMKAVVEGVNAALAPRASTIDPTQVDISGVVSDSAGAPVMGASVTAYDTPAGVDDEKVADRVMTNRAGQYFFTDLDLQFTSESSFKLSAGDGFGREEGQYLRMSRWFGGHQSYDTAPVVGVPTTGADISLPLTGGISGTVSSESALPTDGVQVQLLSQDGESVGYGAATKEDGTYLDTAIVPGDYKVRFVDYAYNDATHAPEWYDNAGLGDALTVTIKSGETTSGINAALSTRLRAVTAPQIKGDPYLGGKLSAVSGRWSLESGTTFTYEWLVGETVVGTGPELSVPYAAKNQAVTLRVTASNRGFDGTAMASTQVIKKRPKVKITVKGKKALVKIKAKKSAMKKIKGKIVVKRIAGTNAAGEPIYKSVGNGKLKKGMSSIKLKRVKKGKNSLVFIVTFKGGKLGDITITKSVKIKR